MPGWRWIHTPGHTAGHISLFRDADRTLLAGDAFVTVKQESALDAILFQRRKVRRPPAYYTTDWDAARRSVAKLAKLEPQTAATGHGLPMHGTRLRAQLRELVEQWSEVAVPKRGRYVAQPAVTDADGVISVPPPKFDYGLAMLAVLGIGAGLALLARSKAAQPWSDSYGWLHRS
jgi:glyoxylase-like metal-dependent hydrolase (beta-lactamase superfamily II)